MDSQVSLLIGNIGKTPEVAFTQKQNKVVTFSIACYRKNPSDKEKPFTDWFNVVAYGDAADIAEQNIKKGMYAILIGKFKTRDYEKDGKKVYVTEFWLDRCGQMFKKASANKEVATTDQINESGSIYSDDDLPF